MFRPNSAGKISGSHVGRLLFGDGGRKGFGPQPKEPSMEQANFHCSMRSRPHRLDRASRSWANDRPSVLPEQIGALRHAIYSPRMVGSIPDPTGPKEQEGIVGYQGYVSRKHPENIHGDRFKIANERARSAGASQPRATMPRPETAPDATQGLQTVPRIPGYMGNVPGANAESVYGLRWEKASEKAQELRRSNPFATSDCWLPRGGIPATATVSMFKGRKVRQDGLEYFSESQCQQGREQLFRLGRRDKPFGERPQPLPPDRVHNTEERYLTTLWKHRDAYRTAPHHFAASGHALIGTHGQLEEMRSHHHHGGAV